MKRFFCSIAVIFFMSPLFAERVNIVLWHAMAGHLGKEIRQITDDFNHRQTVYRIKPVYKGDYVETLTSFAAAFRAKQPPDMVQVFEVGAASMMAPKGVILPVEQLMREQNQPLLKQDFIPVVREFYSKDGQLLAMPLNLSAPILYYNATALEKMGYDAEHFPKTWQEMDTLGARLKKSGYSCMYTSANPAWILVESYLAIHGLPATGTKPLRAIYDYPPFVRHLERLKHWQTLGYFRYGGRLDDATTLFTSGICPLFSQSSGSFNSLSEMVPFKLGIAPMPLDTDASQKRYSNVAGGAALWVVSGRSEARKKGIALFLNFLSQPDIQKRWHEHSGYLPLGLTGVYSDISLSSRHPALALARRDLSGEIKGGFVSNNEVPQHQIRRVNEEAMETLFADLKTADQAVKTAVMQANHLIQRYIRNTA